MYKQPKKNFSSRPVKYDRLNSSRGSLGRNLSRLNEGKVVDNQRDKEVQPKPTVRAKLTFEDLKQQLTAWVSTEKIPGKIQAWYTADAQAENADWRILKTVQGEHEKLSIEAPSHEMEAPEIVTKILEQLKKDHLRIFSKALRQIWFRAAGNGSYALLVQVNLKGRNSAHGYKTFIDFLERNCPEVCSCHHIQCLPDYLFDPASTQAMKVEAKAAFGNDFISIGNSGSYMHVLDWAPRIRDVWYGLPLRIENAIHPNPEDCFFEFYSGSGYVSSMLANQFKRVDAMDCREYAMLSSRKNARGLISENMHFHRGHVEADFFPKFFNKKENEGRWTFYFNLPNDETLAPSVEQAAAQARPERILLQTSNLEVAAKEIKRFRRESYMLRKSIPLYLEPGSNKFDMLFIFVPDRAGILGQNPAMMAKSRNVQRPQERVSRSNRQEQPHFATEVPTFKQRKG
ncbi:MAG: hypothetical protein MJZ25_10190 [Fibrobacter sp.]|nr:hypothetical protein [Fibrobacter sp.]